MRLLDASSDPLCCPDCGRPLASHPADGCVCAQELCDEVATTRVGRSSRVPPAVLCDRHTRAAAASAERFGYALVLQASRQRALRLG